jgi:hypothetical protein
MLSDLASSVSILKPLPSFRNTRANSRFSLRRSSRGENSHTTRIWVLLAFVARGLSAASLTCVAPAFAQQAQAPQQQAQAPQQQAGTWASMPKMQLEQQFSGPLQDTAIQRWRDPQSGLLCYIYLPFTAQHSPPAGNGYVQYGPNAIGSISCLEQTKAAAAVAPAAKPSAPPTKRSGSAPPPVDPKPPADAKP